MLNVLGISRSPHFSPNSVDRDSAIFHAVATKLSKKNLDVSLISEEMFFAVDLSDFDAVFSMARSREVLTELAKFEAQGLVVINSAESMLEVNRAKIAQLFQSEQLPVPTFELGDSIHLLQNHPSFPVWIKRTDSCAQQKDDICFVNSEVELQSVLDSFKERKIEKLIAEKHVQGDLIKFYGVEGSDFFECYYPTKDKTFSKFGNETINGSPQSFDYDKNLLKRQTDKMARLTGFAIYGGDAVVTPSGECIVIDFNDWPSFSPCRKAASKAIAQKLVDILENKHVY